MALEDDLSKANFLSYARTCSNLALDLVTDAHEGKYDTLVIPSRGAVPIFIGAYYALEDFTKQGLTEAKDYIEALDMPYLIKRYVPTHGKKSQHTMNVLLAPFTADINMPKYKSGLDNDVFTDNMRGYWARVVKAFTKKKEDRLDDPFFRFYHFLLTKVEGREHLAQSYLDYPQIKKVAMVDTVISGRASTTILKEFKSIGMDPLEYLVVDQNGNRLKSPFSHRLRRAEAEGSAKLYFMNKLFTEDEGASLEGVRGIVYPSLMDLGSKVLKDVKPIGAGSWHPLEAEGKHVKMFNLFLEALKASIVYVNGSTVNQQKKYGEIVDKTIHEFVKARKDQLRREDKKNPSYRLPFPIVPKPRAFLTGSKVLHICYDKAKTEKLLEDYLEYEPKAI